jgi:hypothetical protein
MSSTQDVRMDAGQLASSEAQAAGAATNLDMEYEVSFNEEYDPNYDPNAPLVDYNVMDPNGEDPVPALTKKEHQRQRSCITR